MGSKIIIVVTLLLLLLLHDEDSLLWMLGLQCRLRHWNRWAPNLHLR
ncbi:MAG: hypothetical protein J6P00_00730 [Acetobacter sp.]|nr:hypothetical protein [Acetobacter sp.]